MKKKYLLLVLMVAFICMGIVQTWSNWLWKFYGDYPFLPTDRVQTTGATG